MGGGEGFEHPPVRCAAAGAAEVCRERGFGHVGAGIASGLAADANLGRIEITPESGMFCAERAIAVIHIIGLARDPELHRAAVASAAKWHHRSAQP